jgi:hypothetical protein
LGHLDTEPDSDCYSHPHSHPDSFGKLDSLPNMDAEANRYPLAGSDAYQYQINHA